MSANCSSPPPALRDALGGGQRQRCSRVVDSVLRAAHPGRDLGGERGLRRRPRPASTSTASIREDPATLLSSRPVSSSRVICRALGRRVAGPLRRAGVDRPRTARDPGRARPLTAGALSLERGVAGSEEERGRTLIRRWVLLPAGVLPLEQQHGLAIPDERLIHLIRGGRVADGHPEPVTLGDHVLQLQDPAGFAALLHRLVPDLDGGRARRGCLRVIVVPQAPAMTTTDAASTSRSTLGPVFIALPPVWVWWPSERPRRVGVLRLVGG